MPEYNQTSPAILRQLSDNNSELYYTKRKLGRTGLEPVTP